MRWEMAIKALGMDDGRELHKELTKTLINFIDHTKTLNLNNNNENTSFCK